jgi:hypothetical protein
MRAQISAICIVLTVAAALVAAQSSQRDTPSTTSIPTGTTPTTTPTTTGTTPTTPAGSTATPAPSTTTTTRPAEPAPLQLPPIGRPDPEAAAVPTRPNGQSPCPGSPAAPASSSQFPGVSASQLPRAGVSADAFVRPGVSAAQLAVLQPGARSAPCAAPRDVILYPDVGTPSRRVPPPGENEP